ncbi:hypothetical protein H105_03711, partial [Trichophyton soudanense CBS 452.61]
TYTYLSLPGWVYILQCRLHSYGSSITPCCLLAYDGGVPGAAAAAAAAGRHDCDRGMAWHGMTALERSGLPAVARRRVPNGCVFQEADHAEHHE